MSLLTDQQYRQLLHNGEPLNRNRDHYPVAKLMMPAVGAVWLLSWLDPDDTDLAFGLCDIGICAPRLCHVSLTDILSLNETHGFAVERDSAFQALHPLSVYALAAQKAGRFVESGSTMISVQRRRVIPSWRMQLKP